MAAVDVFADLGVELYHEGTLAEGLELLAARLDLDGTTEFLTWVLSVATEFLTWVLRVEFTDNGKQNPKPVPTPKPPPPPQPKGER